MKGSSSINNAGQLLQIKEVKDYITRREINYAYDDNGNLTSEIRSGVDFDKRIETLLYTYDRSNRLTKVTTDGVAKNYSYDLAGNMLSDGDYTYIYDIQNRLTSKTGTDGTTSYSYDPEGNLIKTAAPDGTTDYSYNAKNRMILGEKDNGESSAYIYNAMGVRIQNIQIRENVNAGHANANLEDGSGGVDYGQFLSDNRETWQPTWETEVGTTVQNNFETVTMNYTVDYLSPANRDIMVEVEGRYTQRYVYDNYGSRVSAEFNYADNTARTGSGENLASDFAAQDIQKIWYRRSKLDSTLFAVDADGEVIAHAIYDPWGKPITETNLDLNYAGIDNLNNFTGYTWDETLDLYYAQYRFYDADTHRFTQEDPIKDGANWYIYCNNNPTIYVDWGGLRYDVKSNDMNVKNRSHLNPPATKKTHKTTPSTVAKSYAPKPPSSVIAQAAANAQNSLSQQNEQATKRAVANAINAQKICVNDVDSLTKTGYNPYSLEYYAFADARAAQALSDAFTAIDWKKVGTYLGDSAKHAVLGNFSDKPTALGIGMQVGLGLAGVDLPLDIRDLAYDVTHWEWTWGHAGQTALDIVALLPLIGAVKYVDEGAALIKGAAKYGDDILDAASDLGKHADDILDAAGDLADGVGDVKVIGRLEDTAVAIDWAGHDVLNISDWSPAKNVDWVQSGIDNKQTFYLASNPTLENFTSTNPLYPETVFATEYNTLIGAGYTQFGDYMIPPR